MIQISQIFIEDDNSIKLKLQKLLIERDHAKMTHNTDI